MTSNRLALLRDEIIKKLGESEMHRKGWAEAMTTVCIHMAEARQQFKENAEFGKWLDESGIKLSHQDRAAAIKMGGDPKHLMEVLGKTERRSLRHIYANEWGVTHVGKTPKPTPAKEAAAHHAADVLEAGGEKLTSKKVAEQAGIGVSLATQALATRRATEQREIDAAALLSASAKEKLEAAIRAHKKKLDNEFQYNVQQGVRKFIDEHILPQYGDKLKKADAILAKTDYIHRLFPFKPAEYKAILAALHPDNSTSAEKRSELFQLFKSKEDKLKNPVDMDKKLGGMPRTMEDLMAMREARRQKVKEENAAKRAAAKASKH